MATLPLLVIEASRAVIANYRDQPVATAQFVAQAQRLAQSLPQRAFAINLAENRYHFLLGWVAACLRGQVTLLPPNQTALALAELQREYPDHHVFDEAAGARAALAPTAAASLPATELPEEWLLPEGRVVAVVFTSGSTGKPQAHPKTWGSLFHNSRLAARDVLGGHGRHIVATVPAQHMYGLEASLLGALTAGCCLYDRKPFFPADVRAALATLPEPRTLVTTPAHLKVLAAAELAMPALHRVVSATAPLPTELAQQIEKQWRTQVFEIYGCTEAGVMAHRQTTATPRWRTLAGGTVAQNHGASEYRAPQVGVTPLQDVIECFGDSEFLLLGRAGDMIKVAGKRASLQELTRQLLSLPGIEDAVVFVPDEEERPAALVVAPTLDAEQALAQLRQRMEPVFVPRPLLKVEKLPRNELGKLPREALLQLLAQARAPARDNGDISGEILIAADHPALPGHFPGQPIVPGVVLLDAVLTVIRGRYAGDLLSLPNVKFLKAVLPGQRVELRVEFSTQDSALRARFTGRCDSTPVFEGTLLLQSGAGAT